MTLISIRPWLVLAEHERLRWGGDMRRYYIFRRLETRTSARRVDGWNAYPAKVALRRPRRHVWTRPARVATSEFLSQATLEAVLERGVAAVLDFHDDPVRQREALGLTDDTAEIEALRVWRDSNVSAFRWLVAPSASFAAYAGLDPDRVIVAPNGSDTSIVRPGPWPTVPTVGFVSGAAASRGIETLIEAVRRVRAELPTARLVMWLAATGPSGERYLADLRVAIERDPWIEIGDAPYSRIGAQLARATVLVLPTPSHPYWDSVAPVKLFDCLAAGRPIVTTPRAEPARVVDEAGAGIVAAGDGPDDLAVAIAELLTDQAAAYRLGERGRAFVVERHDWSAISDRLAGELLSPRRYHPLLGIGRSR
jgi:glycosyltransferase involved in cell wall biosynthesis